MESNPSCLSSQQQDSVAPLYVQPHYKEAYRLAIYALLCGGRDAYEEFVKAEQIGAFLSEEEIFFILENAELPVSEDDSPEAKHTAEKGSASTYFPTESDEEVPDLDLGWPQVTLDNLDTNISLLFHPPRQNTPTIKEVARKQIQEARQLIAIAMDVFTDVDIFKEIVTAALRGVVVYILLDYLQFNSFLNMSEKLGVRIQDLKNVRVRTVRGQQYQCRSGAKFHGALEQKFMLVDCKTVLYGTYSFMWSFEKINMSMVLVITGQLVDSYDEEFRRLFARSTVPLPKDRPPEHPVREPVFLQSPASSQHSLHRIHMRSRVTHAIRSAKDNGFNGGPLTRGLSMQDRLHMSHHHPDMVRGHSYAGDLQRLNATSQLMREGRALGTPERCGPRQDPLLATRANQFHQTHLSRYGSDQHLIPFNSETSLHKWKINTYMNNSDANAAVPYDVASPQGSQSGLNDNQLQLITRRSLDIKSRLEDVRLKRLSLQECISPRQSQESLYSAIANLERSKSKPLLHDLDSKGVGELEQTVQPGVSMEPADYGDRGGVKEIGQQGNQGIESRGERGEPFTPALFKAASHRDITDAKVWQEPLSRTTSAGNLDMKSKEALLKPFNVRHSRAMESLFEIPEEKDGLARESYGSINKLAISSLSPDAQRGGNQIPPKEERTIPTVNFVSGGTKDHSLNRGSLVHIPGSAAHPTVNVVSEGQKDHTLNQGSLVHSPGSAAHSTANLVSEGKKDHSLNRGSLIHSPGSASHPTVNLVSEGKKDHSLNRGSLILSPGSAALNDGKQAACNEDMAASKHSLTESNTSVSSHHRVDAKSSVPAFQRMNSLRSKVQSLLTTSDEHKSPRKEERMERKNSVRSQKGSKQKAISGASPLEKTPSKDKSASLSRSQNAISDLPETEKLDRSSAQRSSKRKMNAVSDQERGSRITLDGGGTSVPEPRRLRAYSRFEHFLGTERKSPDKPLLNTVVYNSEKDRSSIVSSARDLSADSSNSCSMYQTQTAADNKLGRFMQRFGHLIGKNK